MQSIAQLLLDDNHRDCLVELSDKSTSLHLASLKPRDAAFYPPQVYGTGEPLRSLPQHAQRIA